MAVETTEIAHKLLDQARDKGGNHEVWRAIFETLTECPGALVRPECRKMTLLHQAAFWGNQPAADVLIRTFKAHPGELTNDGTNMDAAGVADSRGYRDLAGWLHQQLAHWLINLARDKGDKDETWDTIFAELRRQPRAANPPEGRAYSVLHQAAYWGHLAATLELISTFGMDPSATTRDDARLDAAGVAESRQNPDLAAYLRDIVKQRIQAAAAAPQVPPSGGAPSGAIGLTGTAASAACPYTLHQAGTAQDPGEGVTVWLCLRAASPGATTLQEWRLYDVKEQLALSSARSAGQASQKVATGTVNFERSVEEHAEPRPRQVICFNVLWEWDSGTGGKADPVWKPYEPEAQLILENAICKAFASATVKVSGIDAPYIVDLVGFRQYSTEDDFKCRRIRRSQGPRLKDRYPEVVRDPDTGKHLNLGRRKVPSYWLVEQDFFSGTKARFAVAKDSFIFKKIHYWMNCTISFDHAKKYGLVAGTSRHPAGLEVVKVEIVMHPRLWRRYLCYKEKLKAKAAEIRAHAGTEYLKTKGNEMKIPSCDWLDEDVMEAYFWHGSGKSADGSVDSIDHIVNVGPSATEPTEEEIEVADGASGRFSKTDSMFGPGVYLADLSSKANLYVPCPVCNKGAYFRDKCQCQLDVVNAADPCYRMLLFRAVLGRVHVETDYNDDKYKGAFNPARQFNADSVMGEKCKGTGLANREYVVYHDSAVYPEFIVHYKRQVQSIAVEKC